MLHEGRRGLFATEWDQIVFNRGISRITFSRSTAFKSSPLKNSVTPFVSSAAVRYGKSVPYTICDIGMSCAIAASVTLLAMVILIDAYPRHDWLMAAVEKRLREELADLQVEINEEKSRIVDLGRGGSFGFLGFDFRRIRSRRGAWRANYTPQLKRRTALQRKLKDVFRRHQSQQVDRVVQLINPILRGWVNYFAVGHSSECFSFIKDWVEKKVRRHMLRARKRKGFGWTRWSRQWLYETLRLFNGYRVRRPLSKVAPAG